MKILNSNGKLKAVVRDMRYIRKYTDATIFDKKTRRKIICENNCDNSWLEYRIGLFGALSVPSSFLIYKLLDPMFAGVNLYPPTYSSLCVGQITGILTFSSVNLFWLIKDKMYIDLIQRTAEALRQRNTTGKVTDKNLEPYTLENLLERYKL